MYVRVLFFLLLGIPSAGQAGDVGTHSLLKMGAHCLMENDAPTGSYLLSASTPGSLEHECWSLLSLEKKGPFSIPSNVGARFSSIPESIPCLSDDPSLSTFLQKKTTLYNFCMEEAEELQAWIETALPEDDIALELENRLLLFFRKQKKELSLFAKMEEISPFELPFYYEFDLYSDWIKWLDLKAIVLGKLMDNAAQSQFLKAYENCLDLFSLAYQELCEESLLNIKRKTWLEGELSIATAYVRHYCHKGQSVNVRQAATARQKLFFLLSMRQGTLLRDRINFLSNASLDQKTARQCLSRIDGLGYELQRAMNPGEEVCTALLAHELAQTSNYLFEYKRRTGLEKAHRPDLKEAQLQSQRQGKAFLYFWELPQHCLLFFIHDKKIRTHLLPRTDSLQKGLDFLLGGIGDIRQGLLANRSSTQAFYQQGYWLYRQVLEVLWEEDIPHRLMVIPDGKFCYLPFESLLYAFSNKNRPRHLLEKTEISYGYFMNVKSGAELSRPRKVFSMRPSENGLQTCPQLPLLRSAENDYLLAKLDAHPIEVGERAENLLAEPEKEEALLHISLHGVAGDGVSPFRVFPAKDGNAVDGAVFFQSIFQKNYIPKALVLASCESAGGIAEAGEGLRSWNRCAHRMGARSTVAALNRVSDEVAAKVLRSFYRHLLDGETAVSALRLAKMDYLKEADAYQSHPFFWAGLLFYGADFSLG